MHYFLLVFSLLAFAGCSSQTSWKRVDPSGVLEGHAWPEEDLEKQVAQFKLGETETQSFHLVRLLGAEAPHVHDRHDASVTMLSGKAKIHYPQKTFEVKKGDIIHIPRGMPHWAENVNGNASEAYVIFSPPFDGKDYRPV